MRAILIFFISILSISLHAQELFTYSEPASNMPAHSMGFRITQSLMTSKATNANRYFIQPEIMYGFSKKIMMHVNGHFSAARQQSLKANGGSVYLKYRFYSVDDVHSHFRMAVYGRGAWNNLPVMQEAIDLNGMNTGFESGMIATKLINKLALSAAISGVYAANNLTAHHDVPTNRVAVDYSFSAGKLMLPKSYVSYSQTNLNVMLECLGQTNLKSGNTFIDLAPSLQFIFLSRLRVDAGYRFPILNNLQRNTEKGWLLRLEYSIFSVK